MSQVWRPALPGQSYPAPDGENHPAAREAASAGLQALAILLIHPSVAVLKDAARQILKLLAKPLLAVDHLADFIFGMQLSGIQGGLSLHGDRLQRGVDIAQAAQLVIEQLALFSPVGLLHQLLAGRAQFNISSRRSSIRSARI